MLNLSTLGAPPKVGYLPGLALSPIPKQPSLRRNVTRNFTLPTQRLDPATVQRAGAVVGGMASALAQLDHCIRQLADMGQMKHQTKQKLMQLVQLSNEVLAAAASQFDSQDGNAVNALSEVLGQAAELLLQLRPDQIESALKHQHNMATSNLNYIP